MLCILAIALLGALGQVELFKIRHQSISGAGQPEGQYPLPAYLPPAQLPQQPYLEQQQQQADLSGVKGAQAPINDAPLLRYQPPNYQLPLLPLAQPAQALAYIIVRPLQTQYHYQYPMEPQHYGRYYSAPQQVIPYRPQPAAAAAAVKGALEEAQQEPLRTEEQYPVKGAPEQPIKQSNLELQQQQLVAPVNAPTKQGKFLKLKESLDRLAASAKSKLTLGSYEVLSEEIIQPEQAEAAQQPLLQQQQQQQDDIKLSQQEQQAITETEHQDRLEASKGSLTQQREELQVKGEREQQEQQKLSQLQQSQQVKAPADESFGELRREQKRLN